MRIRLPLLLSLMAIVSLAFVACSGDDDDGDPTAAPGETTTPGGNGGGDGRGTGDPGPPLSDEGYLEIICTGLEEYTAALMTAREEEPIREAVLDYIASLEAVSPPEDLGEFHQSLIAYLEEAIEHPTDLAVSPRPLPDEDARDRLAGKENDVEACRNATYFAVREEDES